MTQRDPSGIPESVESTTATPWVYPLCIVGLWLGLVNLIARFTWRHGILIFFCNMGVLALLIGARPLTTFLRNRVPALAAVSNRLLQNLAGIGIVLFLLLDFLALGQILENPRYGEYLIDIGKNTYLAAETLFENGQNPYTQRCQTEDRLLAPSPHIERASGEVTIYGVPYYFGYPYFPLMFLSYEPFLKVISDFNAIRIGNALLYLLAVGAVGWLASRFTDSKEKVPLALLSMMTFLGFRAWTEELFQLGITDLLIFVYAVFGFIALTYQRHLLAGILLGLTLAAKLLPGPFFFILAVAWYWKKDGLIRFAGGYLLSALIFIVPFFAADPAAFVSSTILYYLASPKTLDDTSLLYFLPAFAHIPFKLIGYAWLAGLFAVFFRRPRDGSAYEFDRLVKFFFLTYTVFIAFNKEVHLNHMIGIHGFGSIALVVSSMRGVEPNHTDSDLRVAEESPQT